MEKHLADELALVFARDVLRMNNASTSSPIARFNESNAKNIAKFVETLSSEFQALDARTNPYMVINAFKNESK